MILTQTWALIRRYYINIYRHPIGSLFKFILWPILMLGITYSCYIAYNDYKEQDSNVESLSLLPMFTMLLTILYVHTFSIWLVANKATGMKSLMISMGLKQISWYLGNYISFLSVLLPVTLSLAILTAIYVVPELTIPIIILFLLFTLHLTGAIFALTSPIKSEALSSIITLFTVLESQLHPAIIWIMRQSSESMQGFVLFFASLSPYESIRIFYYSHTCTNCTKHLNEHDIVSQSDYLIFLAMGFWTIFALAFARWFDEVCPWQDDTAVKSPLFCFNMFASNHNSDTDAETIYPDPRYFERSNSNRPIGIRIRKLFKSFNNLPVVKDISFNIYKGETTLLLGHNGAGKTTLMNMILGKLTPNSGKVLIESNGQLRNSDNIDGLGVGYCPQTSVSDDFLNVYQHLELFYDIKSADLPAWQREGHIKQTIDDVSMTNHMYKCPQELSGGMKRKLSLAMAFVGKSTILILDEPSSGLDPDSRVFVWDAIRRYRQDRTVLLSTQHMEEADYLGDRIAIMSEGNIICCGSTNFLNNLFGGGYKLRIECPISENKNILAFIHKHFPKAKVPESEQIAAPHTSSMGTNPVQDMVIELVNDNSRDYESHLIKLLEEIETNFNEMSIRSYGLKSSSIEDVMLHTSRHLPSKIDGTVSISIKSGRNRDRLTNFIKAETGFWSKQLLLLHAMLVKNISTIKNDWLNYIFFRIVLVSLATGFSIYQLSPFAILFSPSFFEVAMVMHYINYPAIEIGSKFKIMQLTSPANIYVYWLAQFLVDLISVAIAVAATIISFLIIDHKFELEESATTVYLLISTGVALFGISSAILAYLISTMVTNGRQAVGNFFLLISIPPFASLVWTIISATTSKDLSTYTSISNYIFVALVPPTSLQYIYYGLGSQCYIKQILCLPPKEISPVVFGFASLIAQIIFYTLVLIAIEYYNIDLWYFFKRLCGCLCFWNKNQAPFIRGRETDSDVVTEAKTALSLVSNSKTNPIPQETYSLVAADLRKSYTPGINVIDKLSFTVNRRECFGLLGVNGAGKSTTFSMLVAEAAADSGTIWLNGHFIEEDINKYRNKIGYDPQSNPDMFLTAEETLILMARLRRIDERSIPGLVSTMLEVLEMSEHRNKIACDMSGGTQRKLALGMSLMGCPRLLALDEPTAGVDPVARRGIWLLLRALRMQSGCSIIISSHAMEECEAICDRISIMAQGNLRCIGSFLHLRSKFSQGCSVRLQFSSTGGISDAETHNKIVQEVLRSLTLSLGASVKLADTNINSATFNISDKTMKHSTIFKILREFKKKFPNLNYMVNDSSLEDIFIALAREQQENELKQAQPSRLTGGFC